MESGRNQCNATLSPPERLAVRVINTRWWTLGHVVKELVARGVAEPDALHAVAMLMERELVTRFAYSSRVLYTLTLAGEQANLAITMEAHHA